MPLWISLKNDFGFSINVIISYSDLETKLLMEENLYKEELEIVKRISLINVHKDHSKRIEKVLSEINTFNLESYRLGLVFADRYESFGYAIAISQVGIPLIHIEAGDVTQGGTFDDNVRHAISALSSLFITTNQKARNYLIKNSINPKRVINCGIFTGEKYSSIKSNEDIINQFELKKNKYDFILVFTYHPLSSYIEGQKKELNEIYKALYRLTEKNKIRLIITGVNADFGGDYVSEYIDKFKSFNADISFHKTLGAKNYLAFMSYGEIEKVIIIGNSSSIVKEVPFFNCLGVLIGARQKGRQLAKNTIHTDANSEKIEVCINNSIKNYKNIISTDNPYFVENSVNKAALFIKNVFSNNSNEIINNVYEDINYE